MDGESVLIGSTNNTAVNVACERTNSFVEAALIRTGNADYRERLPEIVNSAILHLDKGDAKVDGLREATARAKAAAAARAREAYFISLEQRSELEARLNQQVPSKIQLEKDIWQDHLPPDEEQDLISIRAIKAEKAKVFRTWRQSRILNSAGVLEMITFPLFAKWAQLHKEVSALKDSLEAMNLPSGEDATKIASLEAEWISASKEAMRATYTSTMRKGADELRSLGIARQGGNGLASTISSTKRIARGWACSALAMRANFPLLPSLFDLVIVDEASQCSLAHIIPMAYRAKRLAVIGDPQQLAPIVKITPAEDLRIAEKHGLDLADLSTRGISFLDGSAYLAYEAVIGTGQVRLLSEHYRCHPIIARWFNAAFYGEGLTVLTDVGELASSSRALVWTDVDGRAFRSKGRSWMNEAEAEAILKEIEEILAEDSSFTVGVVTPFSAQASLLEQMVRDRFSEEVMSELSLVFGTAHRFQGDERDVMLFSTVLTPDVNINTIQWVERTRNLVNVAASRAKSSLRIFGHPSIGEPGILRSPTLAGLRTAAIEGLEDSGASWRIHSQAEKLLYDAMVNAGLAPVTKPTESGYELDFALIGPNKKLNIEVDGSQHFDKRGRQRRQDLVRDNVLRRRGWQVLRIQDWRCYYEAEMFVEKVQDALLSNS